MLRDQFYGVTWNESTDVYTRTGLLKNFKVGAKPYDELMPIHKMMRRCILSDAGAVQYYLDPTNSANKEGVAPSVTGTCEAASAFAKVKDTGVFTATNVKVGNLLHNTTAGKTNYYCLVTARDSDDEVSVSHFMFGGHAARCFGVATTDTANKLIASASNFTTSAVAENDLVYRVDATRQTINATAKVKTVDDANTLALKDWAGSDYDAFPSGNEKFVIFPEPFSTGDTFEICTAVLDGTEGQVMVEIPKFYYQYGFASNTHTWNISFYPLPGFTLHPAFVKDTLVVQNRYYSAFEGFKDGSNKLRSVMGQFPTASQTRATFRTYASAVGVGWSQLSHYINTAAQLLYLVEYASFYSQSMIGNGATTWSATNWNNYNSYNGVWKTGLSITNGNKTANLSPTGNVLGSGGYMTYRGIENFYGHLWKFVDGININNNRAYISGNESLPFADDTATGYTDIGANMINADGYPATLIPTRYGFFPASIGALSSTKITDYYYQNSGWRVAYGGGGLGDGAYAGAFSLFVPNTSSSAYASVAARPCF